MRFNWLSFLLVKKDSWKCFKKKRSAEIYLVKRKTFDKSSKVRFFRHSECYCSIHDWIDAYLLLRHDLEEFKDDETYLVTSSGEGELANISLNQEISNI